MEYRGWESTVTVEPVPEGLQPKVVRLFWKGSNRHMSRLSWKGCPQVSVTQTSASIGGASMRVVRPNAHTGAKTAAGGVCDFFHLI